ncbi:AraC family transcriptional regulator [Prosthecodimorpha hirschii]|uniref:AraC family transcriptional regulator n=1 Tax=Prosthecodimorpha hirschii TaxID=665126 RepID=UPI0015E42C54|nr:AraC family transcriptional regulator [Prosthecomicrobium hirschii]
MPTLRFSTDQLGPRLTDAARVRRWADCLSGNGVSFHCPREDGFRGAVELLRLPGCEIGRAHATSAVGTRTAEAIVRDRDQAFFIFANVGGARKVASQAGRDIVLDDGAITVLDHTRPHRTLAPDGGAAVAIVISGADVAASGLALGDRTGRAPADPGAARLLLRYALGLLADPLAGPDGEAVATQHLTDLVGLAFGAPDRGGDRVRSAAAARARLILTAVRRRAMEPDVDAASVGRDFGLSERTVQGLLADCGTSVGREVLEARLRRAYDLLHGIEPTAATVAAIAFDCGFNSVSTFYRAYRARFGSSPGEARRRLPQPALSKTLAR